jgi:dsDNA-specific endonuclease/ATPase MutS2
LKHSQRKPEELPRIEKLLASIKELNRFLNQARRQEEAVKQLSEIQQALVFSKGKETVPLPRPSLHLRRVSADAVSRVCRVW